MQQRIFAHRGASAYAPENTLGAFALAVKMGAHGVELDIHMTKDGQIVVCHDEDTHRVADETKIIGESTLSELKKLNMVKLHPEYKNEQMPTLEEVYSLLKPSGLHVNVELKTCPNPYPGIEEKCLEITSRCGMESRVIYSSFNFQTLRRVKHLKPDAICGLLYGEIVYQPWEYCKTIGMDALHPLQTEVLLTPEECSCAHALGLLVHPWTVNDPEKMRKLLALGADILITNTPDVALDVLKAHLAANESGT